MKDSLTFVNSVVSFNISFSILSFSFFFTLFIRESNRKTLEQNFLQFWHTKSKWLIMYGQQSDEQFFCFLLFYAESILKI